MIAITGAGIISAIGNDKKSVLRALQNGETGVGGMQHLHSTHDELPVGEVKLTNCELKRKTGLPDDALISRTVLLGIDATKQALEEAGLTAEWLSPEENDIRVRAQMAVAQCIKNTAEATGQTPEQVVKVPGQYAKPYQGNEDEMEMVNESCLRVFACGETITDEPIRYFYSTAGGFYSKWHENCLTFVEKIGPTKFFLA